MQKNLFGLLFLFLFLTLPLSAKAFDYEFSVDPSTQATDNKDFKPGDEACADQNGKCTLRAAIEEANELGSKLKKTTLIKLPEGTYQLATTFLTVNTKTVVEIQGGGTAKTIIKAPQDNDNSDNSVFVIAEGTSTLRGLGITGGNSYGLTGDGAGVYLATPTAVLNIIDCAVYDNIATARIYKDMMNKVQVEGVFGGGIYNNSATVNIEDSEVYNNSNTYDFDGNFTNPEKNQGINQANTDYLYGGGIYNNKGNLNIRRSAIYANDGSKGGGIYNEDGKVLIENTTFSMNSANMGNGYDVHTVESMDGKSLVEIINSTLVNVESSTSLFSGSGNQINLKNSILVGDCNANLQSDGYNLIQRVNIDPNVSCVVAAGTGDIIGDQNGAEFPLLDTFQAIYGYTHIYSLLTGSQAIDSGDPNGCTDQQGNLLLVDQRGLPRPRPEEGRCDRGAAEVGCGDGIILSGVEICDDGNLNNGDNCDSNCTPPACGNGVKGPNEECDDGNLVDGDGCSADCLNESGSDGGNGSPTSGSATSGNGNDGGGGCSLQQIQSNYPASIFWATVLLSLCALGLRLRRKSCHR